MKKHLLLITILIVAATTRLWGLSQFPAGLNADEAALGYNAYSLLETGKDEHGTSWPLVFRSFDDYKPPLYVYLSLPFIKLLGPSTFAIRLPSALVSIASIYLIYLLVNLLFPKLKTKSITIGHLASFLLILSPWHLQFSRGAWEVNTATFFLLFATYIFLKSLKKPALYPLSIILYAASLYTYHSMRIVAPLIVSYLVFTNFSSLKKQFKVKTSRVLILSSLALALILAIPLITQTFAGASSGRFSGVSIFADSGPLWEALYLRGQHINTSLFAKLIHNRYLSYSFRFVKNYLSHFSPRFLFVIGDDIARSRVPGFGQSYLFLFPLFLTGLLKFFKENTKSTKLILFWLFIAPLAASLTFQSPHALRSQNMVIPFTIITAVGLYQLLVFIASQKIFLKYLLRTILGLVFLYNAASYYHQYTVHYPKELGFAWEYGFEQLGEYLQENQNKYDQIIITDTYDQPYILTAFFTAYPPEKLQQELVFSNRDDFGFSTGLSYGKYVFRRIEGPDFSSPNTLLILSDESAQKGLLPLHIINYPNGEPVFKIFEGK